MKLIDILVEELPKMGGWPEGASRLAQDPDGDIQMLSNRHAYLVSVGWTGDGRSDCYGQYAARKLEPLASDYDTSIITREQYEAALAAKSEGWIEWGGGECPPVSTNTVVDVKFKNGNVQSGYPAGEYSWEHVWHGSNIIAYRLHQPQEAEQAKADDEADLNECIGQTPAPVWNGEGLPPVGCECECQFRGGWQKCTILFSGKQIVVAMVDDDEYPFESKGSLFRPTRSEAERKRDAIISIIDKAYKECPHGDTVPHAIYEAIAEHIR